MENIYCIVGASGTGKSTLVNSLEKKGLKVIQSYTTRQPRYEGEKGHLFITNKECDALLQVCNICAYTEFDGERYCVTDKMIEENDLFVVDMQGIKYLKEHYHGRKGVVVIGLYGDENTLRKRMLKRGDAEEKVEQRLAHDKEAFKGMNDICDRLWDTQTSPKIIAKNVYSYIMRREEQDETTEPDEELELTREQEQRNDDIDNAVYNMLLTLLEKSQDDFPWDMRIIGDVTDAIEIACEKLGYHVRHPGIITEPDGTQYYEE